MKTVDYIIEPTKEEGRSTIAIVMDNGAKKYLHSALYPSREETSLKMIIEQNAKDIVIVLGCGIGYHLKPLSRIKDIKKVIIIDILENIDIYANDLSYIKDLHPTFITGPDYDRLEKKLKDSLEICSSTKIFICEHPSSMRLFPAFYSECRLRINKILRTKAGNLLTRNSFSSLFFRNISKNLNSLKDSFPVESLRNLFTGFPAVIISSAPSINNFIEQIKLNKDRMLIICIDSAIPILNANKIKPDFIISIDPQPWVLEHLLDSDKTIPIICSLSSWPLPMFCKKFLSLTTHPICQIIEHLFPDKIGSVDSSTGSVAGDAILTAIHMGCSPIYTAGFDFSFPQHLIYDKNSAYNHRYTKVFNSRIISSESLHMSYIRKSKSGAGEGGIPTRQSFLQFRSETGDLIRKSEKKIFNFKDKGLDLPFAENIQSFKIENVSLSKNQLINKLSTLSTLSSLIDFHNLYAAMLDEKLLSDAYYSAAGTNNCIIIKKFMQNINNRGSL
jgi:hypothetical protein